MKKLNRLVALIATMFTSLGILFGTTNAEDGLVVNIITPTNAEITGNNNILFSFEGSYPSTHTFTNYKYEITRIRDSRIIKQQTITQSGFQSFTQDLEDGNYTFAVTLNTTNGGFTPFKKESRGFTVVDDVDLDITSPHSSINTTSATFSRDGKASTFDHYEYEVTSSNTPYYHSGTSNDINDDSFDLTDLLDGRYRFTVTMYYTGGHNISDYIDFTVSLSSSLSITDPTQNGTEINSSDYTFKWNGTHPYLDKFCYTLSGDGGYTTKHNCTTSKSLPVTDLVEGNYTLNVAMQNAEGTQLGSSVSRTFKVSFNRSLSINSIPNPITSKNYTFSRSGGATDFNKYTYSLTNTDGSYNEAGTITTITNPSFSVYDLKDGSYTLTVIMECAGKNLTGTANFNVNVNRSLSVSTSLPGNSITLNNITGTDVRVYRTGSSDWFDHYTYDLKRNGKSYSNGSSTQKISSVLYEWLPSGTYAFNIKMYDADNQLITGKNTSFTIDIPGSIKINSPSEGIQSSKNITFSWEGFVEDFSHYEYILNKTDGGVITRVQAGTGGQNFTSFSKTLPHGIYTFTVFIHTRSEGQLENLMRSKAILEAELSSLNSELAYIEDRLSDLRSELSNLNSELSWLENELANYICETITIRDDGGNIIDIVEDCSGRYELEAEINNTETEINEINTEIADKENIRSLLNSRIASKRSELLYIENQIAALGDEVIPGLSKSVTFEILDEIELNTSISSNGTTIPEGGTINGRNAKFSRNGKSEDFSGYYYTVVGTTFTGGEYNYAGTTFGSTSSSFSLNNLQTGKYRFTVKMLSSNSTESGIITGESMDFYVKVPATLTITSPSEGTTITSSSAKFSWTGYSDVITRYDYKLSSESYNLDMNNFTTATSFTRNDLKNGNYTLTVWISSGGSLVAEDTVHFTVAIPPKTSGGSSSKTHYTNNLKLSLGNNSPTTNEWIKLIVKIDDGYVGKVTFPKLQYYSPDTEKWIDIPVTSKNYVSDYSDDAKLGYIKFSSSDDGRKDLSQFIKFSKNGYYRIYAEDKDGYDTYIEFKVSGKTTTQTPANTSENNNTISNTKTINNIIQKYIPDVYEDTTEEVYIARSCKKYTIRYSDSLNVYTSPNLNMSEYFISKDYFKRYVDSKNKYQTGCPTNIGWISTHYIDSTNDDSRYTAPNGKVYFITGREGNYYSNELNKELKTPTSFRTIQELKYYIRDRNPLISMAALGPIN